MKKKNEKKPKQKTLQEKLKDAKGLPKVTGIPEKMQARWGAGTIAIPSPGEVNDIMRKVPERRLITVNKIRDIVARKHGATIGCPMTTGIFVWLSARAAEEAIKEGKKNVTPFWRTLKSGGELNENYPGGISAQAARLKKEGHVIECGLGKKPPKVKNYEKHLVNGIMSL